MFYNAPTICYYKNMKKELGVLCHVTCLPSQFGIGDFGRSSFDFLDVLSENNINIWQILLLNDTNVFNCPYGAMSSFSIDEMFIAVEDLVERQLVKQKELKTLKRLKKTTKVNFEVVKKEKSRLLDIAYLNIDETIKEKIKRFARSNSFIVDYAYYKVLLKTHNARDWRKTPKELWDRNSSKGQQFFKSTKNEIGRFIFAQYLLRDQWGNVRAYAKSKKVKILGDLPIYLDITSFDVFQNPHNFKLDKNFNNNVSGGVPADEFCSDGQDWGTCVYNWSFLEKNNFQYVLNRISFAKSLCDIVRLDHFTGYSKHFEIEKKNISEGKWKKGGGEKVFDAIKTKFGLKNFVIEDLGIITEEGKKIKEKFNLKGMNVLQFAFDGDKKNPYLPQNVCENSVYYLGTHDNNTFLGFLKDSSIETKLQIIKMTKSEKEDKDILVGCIKKMLASKSKTIILQIQDFLMQDKSARMNIPGTAVGCWEYRVPESYKKRFAKTIKAIDWK